MNQGLLILLAPPNLDETMVDLFLEQTALSGFTSGNVSAHGNSNSNLSLLEQVTGRQQKTQFMVYADFVELQRLIDILKTKFANKDLRYILISTTESQLI